ncbi:MAG: hypothetical protein U0625_06385 [Phycisphaerales bacterium]
MITASSHRPSALRRAFTLVEILVVCLLMVVLSGLCMDMFSGSKYESLDSAVRIMRADIEYARVLALSSPSDPITFRVNSTNTGYRIARASAPNTALTGPNGTLAVTFGVARGEAAEGVSLTSTGTGVLTFGPFGGIADPVPTLTLRLSGSSERATITFNAFTGDSTVTYGSN